MVYLVDERTGISLDEKMVDTAVVEWAEIFDEARIAPGEILAAAAEKMVNSADVAMAAADKIIVVAGKKPGRAVDEKTLMTEAVD